MRRPTVVLASVSAIVLTGVFGSFGPRSSAQDQPAAPQGRSAFASPPSRSAFGAPEAKPEAPLAPEPAKPADLPRHRPVNEFDGQSAYPIFSVLDDGAIILISKGRTFRVGLLGVSLRPADRAHPAGAVGFLRDELLGEAVYVEDEPPPVAEAGVPKNRAGVPADQAPVRNYYLWRARDGWFVNLAVIERGFGTVNTTVPLSRIESFRKAEALARGPKPDGRDKGNIAETKTDPSSEEAKEAARRRREAAKASKIAAQQRLNEARARTSAMIGQSLDAIQARRAAEEEAARVRTQLELDRINNGHPCGALESDGSRCTRRVFGVGYCVFHR